MDKAPQQKSYKRNINEQAAPRNLQEQGISDDHINKLMESCSDLNKDIADILNEFVGKHEGQISANTNGKSLAFIIGNTGSGKSTLMNYLYGCKMAT